MLSSPPAHDLQLPGYGWLAPADPAADIETLLASGSPPAAILAGLRHTLLAQHGTDLDDGPAGTAELLAWLLRRRPGPFTAAVAALTGHQPQVEPDPGTERRYRLSGAEAARLAVLDEPGLAGWERRGLMRAGPHLVAGVRLRLVPARIGGWDGEPFARIRAGEPCGRVLPGLVRAWRRGRAAWPADPAATGHATLAVAGRGFGFADEDVAAGLVKALAT